MKIFLGYPSERLSIAQEMYDFLKGIESDEIWFDKVSLIPGSEWNRERSMAQKSADLIIHIYADEVDNRPGVVNREIRESLSLAEDQPLGSNFIISIKVGDVRIPQELAKFQYIEFDDDWKPKLLSGILARRKQLSKDVSGYKLTDNVTTIADKNFDIIEYTETAETFSCSVLYHQYPKQGSYWEHINGSISFDSLVGLWRTRSEFLRNPGRSNQIGADLGSKNWWNLRCEEFFRKDELVSVRYFTQYNYAGAAHPNHYVTTSNFFGRNWGNLGVKELLKFDSKAALAVLEYCEKVIALNLELEGNRDSFFSNYKSEVSELWSLISQFGFDRRGMYFNFSPYDILPFVFGQHEVLIPWGIFKKWMSGEYDELVSDIQAGSS